MSNVPHEDDHAYQDDKDPECWACHGEGYYHDCGDDTCCCLNPEEDDCYPCDECGGSGTV